MISQPPSLRPHPRLVGVLLLLLLITTIFWILNIMNIVPGAWTNVLNAIFTGIGSILAVLQWHGQALTNAPLESIHSLLSAHEYLLKRATTKRKGAILVYIPLRWRGTMLQLVPLVQEQSVPAVAISNVILRYYAGHRLCTCYFPLIHPGHYTLVAPMKQRDVQVTVYAGQVTEVDWR